METKKIGVSILICKQIGYETWQDSYVTKVFDVSVTIEEILLWVNSINKGETIATLRFSSISE